MDDFLYPFKPGDWVINQAGRVAKVKAIDHIAGETTFDLILYDRNGDKIGRESPAMGGPRTFEPCCSLDGWERCMEPSFPMEPRWVKQDDGVTRMIYWSPRLPPANWKKPKRRSRAVLAFKDEAFRLALEAIAAGHNDPRSLAKQVLGR